MNYKLKQSNRKTIAIKVVDGSVFVYAPFGVDKHIIEGFVKEKTPWILEKLALYRKLGFDVFEDDIAYVFGSKLQVERIIGTQYRCEISSQALIITHPKRASQGRVNQFVEDKLKEKLDEIIQSSLNDYCGQLGLKVPPYIIRKYKRLYGRCSSKGSLGFNTYLFHESLEFIQYVVLHECAHMIEFNHSKQFYAIIESIMPNYKHIIAQQKRERAEHPDQ
ncbi:hypothetical protein AOC36_05445 [Erysipelothrix larvae]|uniref:YgjP-like metallopeptidase domain-containing protein n=1 Tax=Erysipelothrix larvae TaxID=1514105 RepID=A0A0X8GZS9_9FIRM|nr:YgjP-like metallopeptidase domain-containing protein [Erysipelothrix larvae]AMC93443.1 hypothetical protein AOC36_05445 [Erysipelothrix larvae]